MKVHDPKLGVSPIDKNQTRIEYLQFIFGLKPRSEYLASSKQFAGWKNPLLTNSNGMFFTVEFFPSTAGDLFFKLWKLYLLHQRVSPSEPNLHPYAFTSKTGDPLSIKAYSKARKRAVERIGLEYSKQACTTAHSDRHSYGQNLAENGVPPLIIKTAMHHRSMDSQFVYTQPSEDELRSQLKRAEDLALDKSVFGEIIEGLDE